MAKQKPIKISGKIPTAKEVAKSLKMSKKEIAKVIKFIDELAEYEATHNIGALNLKLKSQIKKINKKTKKR